MLTVEIAKKNVITNTTGWGSFKRKASFANRVFVERFVVQLCHTNTMGQYEINKSLKSSN